MHQAASLEVEGAVVEREPSRRVQVIDERLPCFGRRVTVDEQPEVEVDQALG